MSVTYSPQVRTTRQEQAIARRRAQRDRERADEAERAKRAAKFAARMLRKHPEIGAEIAADGGRYMESQRFDRPGDRLQVRVGAPPFHHIRPYKGWREDHRRRCAYLEILPERWSDGLPLAHEGGRPTRCRDEVTWERSRQNYAAQQTA